MSLCLNKKVENELRALPGNNICCDCDGKMPQWASVSFGVFMCLECSGRHRALGVHISFVRSVSMDSWSEKQINMMRCGGNDKCNAFLKQYGVSKETMIPQKYNSPAALLYRDRLSAEVEGRPLPTQLPSPQSSISTSNNGSTKSTVSSVAGGTDPLPGETEAQYVARQKQLQEEARERMRQKFGGSNGLSSSGRMQGIGSDASYNPNEQGGGGGGIDYSAASQQAYSIFQTGLAYVGDTVNKFSEPSADGQPSTSTKTWSMLTTSAVDLWSKATAAAANVVDAIQKPEEDDGRFPRAEELRFPRPPGAESGTGSRTGSGSGSKYVGMGSNSNTVSQSGSANNSTHGVAGGSSRVSSRSNGSWDDLDDLLNSNRKDSNGNGNGNNSNSSNGGGGGGIAFNDDDAVHSRVAALKLDNPSKVKPVAASNSRTSLASNHNSVDNLADHSTGSPGKSLNNSGSTTRPAASVGASGHVKPPVAAASPVGDDFFNSFGI